MILRDREKACNCQTQEKQKDYKSLGKNDNLEITSAGYVFIKNMDYIKKLIDISVGFIDVLIGMIKSKIEE